MRHFTAILDSKWVWEQSTAVSHNENIRTSDYYNTRHPTQSFKSWAPPDPDMIHTYWLKTLSWSPLHDNLAALSAANQRNPFTVVNPWMVVTSILQLDKTQTNWSVHSLNWQLETLQCLSLIHMGIRMQGQILKIQVSSKSDLLKLE